MSIGGIRGAWQRLKAKLSRAVAQDCPPELAACQVCQRHHCQSEEWLKCERRLAAKRYLEQGNRAGLEQLRQAPLRPDTGCVKAPVE
jgi:hypothetical protein